MTGATRSRVDFFMNRFRKREFIAASEGLTINRSLVSVVLHD